MKKSWRIVFGFGVVLLTGGEFAYYISHHTYLLKQLGRTSPWTIIFLLLLYAVWFGTLGLMIQASLRLCRRKTLPAKENLLLNSYSTLTNFFVPGQGGTVVRGVYLNKHQRLPYKSYILVTLLSYGMYASLSAILLFGFSRPWWQALLAILIVCGLSLLALKVYEHSQQLRNSTLDWQPAKLFYLLLANLLQVICQVAIYSIELHSINPRIALHQSLIYTGAANFALFVALTPGAIGIRESFLLFSQRLHHISSANIVAASIIDRSAFIVFLGVLFIITLMLHAKKDLLAAQPLPDKKML